MADPLTVDDLLWAASRAEHMQRFYEANRQSRRNHSAWSQRQLRKKADDMKAMAKRFEAAAAGLDDNQSVPESRGSTE